MFGIYTKAILSALAGLAALISAATAYYVNNNGGFGSGTPGQSMPPGRVHGAPGPEMGAAGGAATAIAVYGLYLVARRRRKQD